MAVWNTQTRHMEEYVPKYHAGGVLQMQTISSSSFLTLARMGGFPVVTEEKVLSALSTVRRGFPFLRTKWIVRR